MQELVCTLNKDEVILYTHCLRVYQTPSLVACFIPGLGWFQNVGLQSQTNLVVPFQFLGILIEIVQWLLAVYSNGKDVHIMIDSS